MSLRSCILIVNSAFQCDLCKCGRDRTAITHLGYNLRDPSWEYLYIDMLAIIAIQTSRAARNLLALRRYFPLPARRNGSHRSSIGSDSLFSTKNPPSLSLRCHEPTNEGINKAICDCLLEICCKNKAVSTSKRSYERHELPFRKPLGF